MMLALDLQTLKSKSADAQLAFINELDLGERRTGILQSTREFAQGRIPVAVDWDDETTIKYAAVATWYSDAATAHNPAFRAIHFQNLEAACGHLGLELPYVVALSANADEFLALLD